MSSEFEQTARKNLRCLSMQKSVRLVLSCESASFSDVCDKFRDIFHVSRFFPPLFCRQKSGIKKQPFGRAVFYFLTLYKELIEQITT